MSEWVIEGKRQMLAEVAVAPLSLPWCKSGCSSPEYRWHYTSNPLNGWDTLTCWCLEWPASISSAFAMPNTFVNLTAKSLSLGHASEDILYHLVLTLGSPVNVLHCFFGFFSFCNVSKRRGPALTYVENWSALKLPDGTEESTRNGKYCLNAQSF